MIRLGPHPIGRAIVVIALIVIPAVLVARPSAVQAVSPWSAGPRTGPLAQQASAGAGRRASGPTTVKATPGKEIFWDRFTSADGFTAWQLVQRVSPNRIQTVRPPGERSLAVRFEVRYGDHLEGDTNSRAELGYTKQLACEGDQFVYSWSTMLASDFPQGDEWQDLAQWKNEGVGTPPLQITADRDSFGLLAGPQLGYKSIWRAPMVRGRWVTFQVAIQFSSDPGIGWVDLTFDGHKALDQYPMATLYPDVCSYFKLGLYRSAAIVPTGVVYDRDMLIIQPS